MSQYGQHPDPSHVIAHVSDPHLRAAGGLLYDAIDSEAHLRETLVRLGRVEPRPQALVFTGDLADKAEPKAYARIREIVEPAAAAWGAQVIWVMGNHDERAAYSAGLFDGESEAPQDRVYDVDGLRIVALDTSVPGYHHGDLTPEQLGWLADVLATPAPHGTILALHHPPIPSPMLPPAEVIELRDQEALAEVVRSSDVRAVLAGHLHYSTYSTFAGVVVSVASATCYLSDPAPDDRLVSALDAHQSVNVVHVYPDRVVHSIVPLAESPEVNGFPASLRPQLEAMDPEERFEMLARKDSPFNAGDLPL